MTKEAMPKHIESINLLTVRELEYLSLVAMGLKNHCIAQSLNVTISAVKKALESIFHKLNAKDRANAVAIAFVHNIITVNTISNIAEKYKKGKIDYAHINLTAL